jgi:hypothetical protein
MLEGFVVTVKKSPAHKRVIFCHRISVEALRYFLSADRFLENSRSNLKKLSTIASSASRSMPP